MKTQVTFRNFKGLEHLKTYIQDCVESSISRLDSGFIDEVRVIVGTTHARRQGHPPEFSCEAILKTRKNRFFVKKVDSDFQTSVKKCMKALSRSFISTTRNIRDKKRKRNSAEEALFLQNLNFAQVPAY